MNISLEEAIRRLFKHYMPMSASSDLVSLRRYHEKQMRVLNIMLKNFKDPKDRRYWAQKLKEEKRHIGAVNRLIMRSAG
jgi:hypothetical protein